MVPRGAVAIVCVCARTARIALVTRAKPPDTGVWSLPGGKIELGEPTMVAAARELQEECNLSASDVRFHETPFTVTDVIRPAAASSDPGSKFHYLLAQTFCSTLETVEPSQLTAGDDAGDARWCSLDDMNDLDGRGQLASGVIDVVQRGLQLYSAGFLPLQDR